MLPFKPPTFHLNNGYSLVLKCIAGGMGKMKVTWKFMFQLLCSLFFKEWVSGRPRVLLKPFPGCPLHCEMSKTDRRTEIAQVPMVRKQAFVRRENKKPPWSFLFNESYSSGWECQRLVPTHAARIPHKLQECRFLYPRAAAKWSGTSNRWLHCHRWGRRREELFWFFCWTCICVWRHVCTLQNSVLSPLPMIFPTVEISPVLPKAGFEFEY